MDGIEIKNNRIDKSIPIYVIHPNNAKWVFFSGLFEEYGHAFYSSESNIIFLDGRLEDEEWFTDDHLYVIEAHELAHKLAGHTHGHDIQSEKEADFLGYNILKQMGLVSASQLHKEEFKNRYKISVEEFDVPELIERIISEL
jgi:hypothetical protein